MAPSDTLTLADTLEPGLTLPASWFTDPEWFALEQKRIFSRYWQYAGLASQIPNPGDYFRCKVGLLPVVIVRDETAQIRAFANVCPHRGAEIVTEDCGHRMTLQCQYHAWTFALDGSLRKAPRSERNTGFDPSRAGLFPLKTDTFGPLIFVNPDLEARSFAETYGDWITLVGETGIDFDVVLKPRETRRFELDANWKVLAQNNVECYHCPTNHPTLAKVSNVDVDMWVEPHDTFMRYGNSLTESGFERSGDDAFYRVAKDERSNSILNHLFPNFFCAMMPGNGIVIVSVALPIAVDKCVYQRQYCFADSVSQEVSDDACAFFDNTFREDIGLCNSVQRGLSTGYYDQGQLLLPTTEPGVDHIGRMAYAAMTQTEIC